MPKLLNPFPRISSLILLLALPLLLSHCSSGDGGFGDVPQPYKVEFTPDGSDYISVEIEASSSYLPNLTVTLEANGIPDLFAVFFPLSFDRSLLRYTGFSSSGGVLGISGTDANYQVSFADQDPTSNILIVGVSREGYQSGGVSATGTILTLQFTIIARDTGRFDFPSDGPWEIGAFNSTDSNPATPEIEPTLIFGAEGFTGGSLAIM